MRGHMSRPMVVPREIEVNDTRIWLDLPWVIGGLVNKALWSG